MALSPLSPAPAPVYRAPPRVDLPPPAEKHRRSLARLQQRWFRAVLVVLAVSVLAVLIAIGVRLQAGMALRAAEAERTTLQTQLAAHAEVSAMVSERDNLTTKRAEALAADMAWSKPYRLLTPVLPPGARLTGFSATAGGVATGNPDEIGLKGVAVVESLRAIDQAIVLDAFGQVDHVIDVDMLGLTRTEAGYTYEIHVAFDQGIYNTRFQTGTQEEGQ